MPGRTRRTIKVGLCGVSMKLTEYPRTFGVLEVQQTFYQPPAMTTLERWKALMPPDFEFTVKAWQLVTHAKTSSTYRRLKRPMTETERSETGGFRDTAIVQEGWETTVVCARALAATAILFQCPASFRPTEDNAAAMRAFFRRITRPDGMRMLWEPRGPWPAKLVQGLCTDLDLVHVVDPFVTRPQTRDPAYFRLHGVTGARHVYTDEELRTLEGMLPKTGEVYVMFNNMPRVGDAKRFISLLGP